MRTKKSTSERDIEPEYDFHDAELNPYAERYRGAERAGTLRMPADAPAGTRRPEATPGRVDIGTPGAPTRTRNGRP